jgi:hypothetical protein
MDLAGAYIEAHIVVGDDVPESLRDMNKLYLGQTCALEMDRPPPPDLGSTGGNRMRPTAGGAESTRFRLCSLAGEPALIPAF